MIRNFIFDYIKKRQLTLLGAGPMSANCVDVAIDLANRYHVPLMLIASRRQVECAAMGGGYVEGWSTEKFVEYVRARDRGGQVILARDHGGPWQHPKEKNMSLPQAMQSARDSYTADILSGMQIIHIDPSVDPSGMPGTDELVERVFDLYTHCWEVAQKNGRDIAFEVGTEEQGPDLKTAKDFARILTAIKNGCRERNLPQPLFVVGQTGTKVMERRNTGMFEEFTGKNSPADLREMLAVCNRNEVLLKEHNTDYLSNRALAYHLQLGIHAANVAPEFGVVESLAFLRQAESLGKKQIAERFLELSYQSRKWEKWMLPGTAADDRERAIISGHYVFATPEFRELKNQLSFVLRSRKMNLDEQLRAAITDSMMRYLVNFGLVDSPQMQIAA